MCMKAHMLSFRVITTPTEEMGNRDSASSSVFKVGLLACDWLNTAKYSRSSQPNDKASG